jgi:hypothetical protein
MGVIGKMVPENKPVKEYLSKSLFVRGLQCHKSLYLYKFHPELRDEVSVSLEARFRSGTEVGILAQKLFPGGVEIPHDDLSYPEQVSLTKKEIDNGTKTIYEAAVSFKGILVKVDILHKGKGGWRIYEVKGSTSLKDEHIDDIAVQYYVLKGSGINVTGAYLVHVNNEYVRSGEIEVKKLFTLVDLTEEIKAKQDMIADEIKNLRNMLKGGIPEFDIGGHCSNPYECDFHGHCWEHIPEHSVFSLGGRGVKKFDLYRQGIVHLEDVPLDILNDRQRKQAEAYLQRNDFLDRTEIESFIDTLWYPLCFLDFETIFVPVPPFDGIRPYQQIPFQYSLHCLEEEGAEPTHSEYLASPNIDPREKLISKLIKEIPENACTVVYNKSFEKGVLQNLGEWLPKYKGKADTVIENLRDLADPFRKKDYYHWEMKGSYSMKAVLPAMVSDLSYDNLEISEGGMASEAYKRICRSEDTDEIKKIQKALLEYCRLDTLGMVRILERLKELV